jgi:hypothetical protein
MFAVADSIAEGVKAGAKAAVVACIASAVPTVSLSIHTSSVILIPLLGCMSEWVLCRNLSTVVSASKSKYLRVCVCCYVWWGKILWSQLAAVRMVPWAKANLNYTGQSLIICGGNSSNSPGVLNPSRRCCK